MTYENEKDPNENEPAETPANDPIVETGAYTAPQTEIVANYPVEEVTPEYTAEGEIDYNNVEELNDEPVEETGGRYIPVAEYPYNPYRYNDSAQFQPTPTPFQPTPAPVYAPVQPNRDRKMKRVMTGTSIALLLTFLGMLSFVFVSLASNGTTGAATVPAVSSASTVLLSTGSGSTTNAVMAAPNNQLTVQQVVQKVTPAVVQITAQQTVTTRNSRTATGSGTTQATGVGTGIIYDASGYILTNNHVVEGADSLLVTLTDGRSFTGTVVGTDPQTDLAVVKITADNLTVAALGDSDALQVGDGLVAIGNALALPGGPTVTAGVVSALNRSVAEPAETTTNSPFAAQSAASSGTQLYGLIQTDAAINPGNSGGPLINMAGEVVGINTLGAGTDDSGVQIQGIGFAISINQAKEIAQQLVASGSVNHAVLGISSEPLTAAIAKEVGVNFTQGTIIDQVQSGSAAAQAGLKQGDIITAIDGTKLTGESTLGEIIIQHQPGDKVTLTVVSPTSNGGTGAERTVEVTLGSQTANQ